MQLLSTPQARDHKGVPGDGFNTANLARDIALLPTPAVNDMGMAYTPEEWDAWTEKMKAKHGNGNGHGKSLNVEAQRLLPTPTRRDHKDSEIRREPHRPDDVDTLARALTDVPAALLPTPSVADSTGGHERRGGERGEELLLKGVVRAAVEGRLPLGSESSPTTTVCCYCGEPRTPDRCDNCDAGPMALLPTPRAMTPLAKTSARARELYGSGDSMGDIIERASWGEYEPAIRRWEAITRPAPEPTKPNSKGSPKLSDEFDEWLMGLPAGWITDVPGVTWNETLKACGNGVVPQQGAAALRWLLAVMHARI